MGNVPTSQQVEGMLADIEHNVARLRELWRWAAPSIYERPKRQASQGARSQSRPCSRCRATGVIGEGEEQMECPDCGGDKAFATSHDGIGALLESTERFRTKAGHAAREIRDARNRVGTAVADLNDALNLLDPPLGPEVADVRLRAHPAAKKDLARAKAAQARRSGRAQRTGDYGEVTG